MLLQIHLNQRVWELGLAYYKVTKRTCLLRRVAKDHSSVEIVSFLSGIANLALL